MADFAGFNEVMNTVKQDPTLGAVTDFSDFKKGAFDGIKLPVASKERSKKIYYLPKDTISKITTLASQQGFQSDSAFLTALIDQFD